MAEPKNVAGYEYTPLYDDVPPQLKNERRALLALMAENGSDAVRQFNQEKRRQQTLRNQSIEAAAARGQAVHAPRALETNIAQGYDSINNGIAGASQEALLAHNRELDRIGMANAAYMDQVGASAAPLKQILEQDINNRQREIDEENRRRQEQIRLEAQLSQQRDAAARAAELELLRIRQAHDAAEAEKERRWRSAMEAAARSSQSGGGGGGGGYVQEDGDGGGGGTLSSSEVVDLLNAQPKTPKWIGVSPNSSTPASGKRSSGTFGGSTGTWWDDNSFQPRNSVTFQFSPTGKTYTYTLDRLREGSVIYIDGQRWQKQGDKLVMAFGSGTKNQRSSGFQI